MAILLVQGRETKIHNTTRGGNLAWGWGTLAPLRHRRRLPLSGVFETWFDICIVIHTPCSPLRVGKVCDLAMPPTLRMSFPFKVLEKGKWGSVCPRPQCWD